MLSEVVDIRNGPACRPGLVACCWEKYLLYRTMHICPMSSHLTADAWQVDFGISCTYAHSSGGAWCPCLCVSLRVNHACCTACTTSIGYLHGVLCSKVYCYNMNHALGTLISECIQHMLWCTLDVNPTGRGEHQAGGEVPHELIAQACRRCYIHPPAMCATCIEHECGGEKGTAHLCAGWIFVWFESLYLDS